MGVQAFVRVPSELAWDPSLVDKLIEPEDVHAWVEERCAQLAAFLEGLEKLISTGWVLFMEMDDLTDPPEPHFSLWHPDIDTEEDARAAFKELGLNPDDVGYSFLEYEDEEDEDWTTDKGGTGKLDAPEGTRARPFVLDHAVWGHAPDCSNSSPRRMTNGIR